VLLEINEAISVTFRRIQLETCAGICCRRKNHKCLILFRSEKATAAKNSMGQTRLVLVARKCNCAYYVNCSNISFAKGGYYDQPPPYSSDLVPADFSLSAKMKGIHHPKHPNECHPPSQGDILAI
jgi:hypothetical protein